MKFGSLKDPPLDNAYVDGACTLFVFLLVLFVGVPLRSFALVFSAYGLNGYFHDGIRVLFVKPARFSDGNLVAPATDLLLSIIVLGLSIFAATTVFLCFRLYARLTKNTSE
jgi:hypothetical protein